MELRQFVKTSLLEILEGVREAATDDIAIAPAAIEGKPIWTERLINFEVYVEVDRSGKGGAKVLSVIEANAEIKKVSGQKLSFSVPVHMNVQKAPR